ncbi:hypothetical protein [Rhizobium sp. NFR03]|uniref:hypothetical protein n=1 Tax=Rhizobium sp. NFR03 TaxID=1566263 RepID=UPI0008D303D3|nr:hypothetical protein [Rhizobium sp. NFR03]SES33961.1 hypothetical protein SAMN03159406_03542 [Rhizobium sp. NFR03]
MVKEYRLSVFQAGKLARHPVELTDVELRAHLLVVTDFDEPKVNGVCKYASRCGRSEFSLSVDGPYYVVERVPVHATA